MLLRPPRPRPASPLALRSSALGPRPSSRGEGMVCPRSAAATLPFIRRLFQNGHSDGTYISNPPDALQELDASIAFELNAAAAAVPALRF